ncbi:hypothetical protein OF83DRAFT_1089053 [Amylostereum chailletii]|nr:hypothetical protein OF83DRAFT_1089053 [Amylostereum chailletii]
MDTLVQHPEWNPFYQLVFAMNYKIAEWLEPALRALVFKHPEEITKEHARYLGVDLHWHVVQTCSEVTTHRTYLAYTALEYQQGVFCMAKDQCQAQWKEWWFSEASRLLLHPDVFLRGADILKTLEDTEDRRYPGLCYSCHIASLEEMKATGALLEEDAIIQRRVELLSDC